MLIFLGTNLKIVFQTSNHVRSCFTNYIFLKLIFKYCHVKIACIFFDYTIWWIKPFLYLFPKEKYLCGNPRILFLLWSRWETCEYIVSSIVLSSLQQSIISQVKGGYHKGSPPLGLSQNRQAESLWISREIWSSRLYTAVAGQEIIQPRDFLAL